MSKKYVDQVVDNYGKNFEKANNEIDTALNDFYITIDSILKENTFPEEQMTKWTTLLQTASVKASELKIKIDEKYKQMTEKATYYDEIVSLINSKAGDKYPAGYKYTKADMLEMVDEYWVVDSGAAAMDIDEGYPWAFYHLESTKKTRTSTDNWSWVTGTTTCTDYSKIIKKKEDLDDIPNFGMKG